MTRSRPRISAWNSSSSGIRAGELDLDLFGRALAECERVLALHERQDGLVELVTTDAARFGGNDPTHRDHRDLGGATADVDDHVAGRLVNREPCADRGGHRLLDHHDGLACTRVLRRLLHGAPFDAGDPRRDADHHSGLRPSVALVHPLDEVAEHLLADVEVGDHAVLQRTHRHDVARRATEHPLGLRTDRQDVAGARVHRHDRRLVEHDALAPHVDDRVRRSEVDGHVAADDIGVPGRGHRRVPRSRSTRPPG